MGLVGRGHSILGHLLCDIPGRDWTRLTQEVCVQSFQTCQRETGKQVSFVLLLSDSGLSNSWVGVKRTKFGGKSEFNASIQEPGELLIEKSRVIEE
jgi:hypothetical protein